MGKKTRASGSHSRCCCCRRRRRRCTRRCSTFRCRSPWCRTDLLHEQHTFSSLKACCSAPIYTSGRSAIAWPGDITCPIECCMIWSASRHVLRGVVLTESRCLALPSCGAGVQSAQHASLPRLSELSLWTQMPDEPSQHFSLQYPADPAGPVAQHVSGSAPHQALCTDAYYDCVTKRPTTHPTTLRLTCTTCEEGDASGPHSKFVCCCHRSRCRFGPWMRTCPSSMCRCKSRWCPRDLQARAASGRECQMWILHTVIECTTKAQMSIAIRIQKGHAYARGRLDTHAFS